MCSLPVSIQRRTRIFDAFMLPGEAKERDREKEREREIERKREREKKKERKREKK